MTSILEYKAMMIGQFAPFFFLLIPLIILDVALKGWGMWRAARMDKPVWFVALLLVNSLGILPAIFLLMTNDEYVKKPASAASRKTKR